MKITGKVVKLQLNKVNCAFIAVREMTSQDKTMFVSETNNGLFQGQELAEGDSVTITALEEQSFEHSGTRYYRPLKVVVNNGTGAALNTPEEHSETLSKATSTNTKVENKTSKKTSPRPHVMQRKVYGRVSELSFSDKTAKISIIDDHTETGEVLDVTFKAIPRDFEDGMRISCNVETSEIEGGTKTITVKATHRTYEDERKGMEEKLVKIIYGNARNVAAKAVGIKDMEKFNKLAMDIYTKGKAKREELKKEFPDMDDFDLGAKWGDSMKQAGNEYKSVAKIIEVAEVLFRNHVEAEKGLV